MNQVFQSSNYTPGGAPCNPRDRSPCFSGKMGISHMCTLPTLSGVQANFPMEYLLEVFTTTLNIVQASLWYCCRSLMNYLSPQEKLCFKHQRFCAPETGGINYYDCLLVIQESTKALQRKPL